MCVAPFTLEFYAVASGDQSVLRWLREDLTPAQPAIGVAIAEILQVEGIGVCRGAYGNRSATAVRVPPAERGRRDPAVARQAGA
jgi:hypothetical protein